MAESADIAVFSGASPRIRVVGMDRPWLWLARGLEDMRRSAPVSYIWALIFVAAGSALIAGLALLGFYQAILPVAVGFPLVAPILVVGLYEVSRRLERGEKVDVRTPLAAWLRNTSQIGFLGFVLGFVFLAWLRIATLLFAWFFGTAPFAGMAEFASQVVFTGGNILFLVVGIAVGAVLAVVVFAVAAVSVPMLLDRDVSVFTAIATSCAAVRANPRPMLLWAVLVVLFIGAGLLVALAGLVLTLPLVAHATWHAYRDLVAPEIAA